MPSVLGTFLGGTGILSGQLTIADEGMTNLRQLYWPAGINALRRHGSGYVYGNRNYLVGAWSANLLVDEGFRCLRQGIIPPQSPPTVSVGGGAIDQICYLAFYDELTDERSSLSEGFALTGNTTRAWTVLPTEVPGEAVVLEGLYDIAGSAVTETVGFGPANLHQTRPGDKLAISTDLTRWMTIRSIASATSLTSDGSITSGAGVTLIHRPISRCSHVELWVAVAGSLPRLAARVPLGVTTFNEAVATLFLGEAFLDTFEPPPFCTMNVSYADRQISAGDPRNRDTVYLSNLFRHEQYAGLSFKTRKGEPVMGLIPLRDYVLVVCPDSSYVLQGYTEDDLTFRIQASDLGGFGHVTNIVLRDVAYIPNNKGYFMFNGAWHLIIEDNLSKWTALYKRYRLAYESGIALHDLESHTLFFVPNYLVGTPALDPFDETVVWTCDYTPIAGVEAGAFSQPNWSWDSQFVVPNALGTAGAGAWISGFYSVPTASSLGVFYKAGANGELVEEDPDDFTLSSGMELVTGHLLLGVPGGDIQEGKTAKRSWGYWYGETAACTWNIYGGDEYAGGDNIARVDRTLAPDMGPVDHWPVAPAVDHQIAVAATELVGTYQPDPDDPPGFNFAVWEALICHTYTEEVVGRGFTHRFRFVGRGVEFYGLGGYYGPGTADRTLTYAFFQE